MRTTSGEKGDDRHPGADQQPQARRDRPLQDGRRQVGRGDARGAAARRQAAQDGEVPEHVVEGAAEGAEQHDLAGWPASAWRR